MKSKTVKQGDLRWRWSVAGLVLAALLVIPASLLAFEHRAHLLAWLPLLIILICPLMHVLMHRGHRRAGRPAPVDEDARQPPHAH